MSRYNQRLKRKHLAIFEWYVMAWARHFGVHLRWEILVDWHSVAEDFANIRYLSTARKACICLVRDYDDDVPLTIEQIAKSACHEIVHLLLAPLADHAENGAPRGVSIGDVEHEIVLTLTQITMRDHFDRLREACPHKV